jgi:hypothetical protein
MRWPPSQDPASVYDARVARQASTNAKTIFRPMFAMGPPILRRSSSSSLCL